jgi:hypothetical protein
MTTITSRRAKLFAEEEADGAKCRARITKEELPYRPAIGRTPSHRGCHTERGLPLSTEASAAVRRERRQIRLLRQTPTTPRMP